jgi:hypothetical protein
MAAGSRRHPPAQITHTPTESAPACPHFSSRFVPLEIADIRSRRRIQSELARSARSAAVDTVDSSLPLVYLVHESFVEHRRFTNRDYGQSCAPPLSDMGAMMHAHFDLEQGEGSQPQYATLVRTLLGRQGAAAAVQRVGPSTATTREAIRGMPALSSHSPRQSLAIHPCGMHLICPDVAKSQHWCSHLTRVL